MITLQTIRDTVIDWIEDDSDTAIIDRTINGQLRFVCRREFEGLRRSADVTPDSDGVITVPPLCQNILGIYEQCAYGTMPKFGFMARTARPRADEPRSNRYLYHPYESSRTAGATGLVLGGTQGGDTLTEESGTSITADMAGKELVLAGDNTRYLIVSATADTSMTIFPTLRLYDSSVLAGTVDPVGTKRYVLTKPDGNIYTDAVTIDYQIEHPALVLADDPLLIPMERTVALLTVQQFLQQSKYDVDAERLERAIMSAQLTEYGSEPSNSQDNVPKDTSFAFRTKRGIHYRRR